MLRATIQRLPALALGSLVPAVLAQETATLTLPKVEVSVYGSLRATLGVQEGGTWVIVNNASRLGLKLTAPLGGSFKALGGYEAGINLVEQNPSYSFSGGDDNPAVGEGSQALTTRLGYLGVQGAFGSLTMGKQWSVYYDIGDWTDRFNQVGGEAQGSYNAGTDGGISGTGRAENALIYRAPALGPVELGFQVQLRQRTAADVSGADTWGASVRWAITPRLSLGGAVNVVNDGVADPGLLEPKEGDRAALLGVKFQDGDQWTLALTVSKSEAHEVDDAGTYFDAVGAELYGAYRVRPGWIAYAGLNDLRPTGDAYAGQYRKSYLAGGVTWVLPVLGGKSVAFLEVKVDQGRDHLGLDTQGTAAGLGLRLTF